VPELGQKLDLTTDLLDYREVDGVKLPFKLSTSSAVQNYTIAFEKIEHNVPIDAAVFTKPAPQ
jgi:hypothetical protein